MTNHDDFKRLILAAPEDNQNRLVYADWLDEHDRPAAAARLRWFVGLREHLQELIQMGRAKITPHKSVNALNGMPDWARRLAETEIVRRTLLHRTHGFDSGVIDPQTRDYALHVAELQHLGLASADDRDAARASVNGAHPDTTYHARQGLRMLFQPRVDMLAGPVAHAQWGARGRPDWHLFALTHAAHKYAMKNPPPTEATQLARRGGEPVRLSLNDTIAELHPQTVQHGGQHDTAAGGVLADALDEAGLPHAPFFRNLVRRARWPAPASTWLRIPLGSRHGTYNGANGQYYSEDASTARHVDPYPQVAHAGVAHRFIPVVSDTSERKWAVDRGITGRSPATAGTIFGLPTHTAIMDAPALREWAAHPKIHPELRTAIMNAANELDPHGPAQLALGLGGLVSKVRGWFGKTPPPRDGRDGIVHTHSENPTGVYAEKNAVAQALRLLGAPDHMKKVDRYTAHIARFVKEHPEHRIVKEYADKAGVIGGTAGPELTDAVKPLVGAVNLLLSSHGFDERFKRPETESRRAAFEHTSSAPEEPTPAVEPTEAALPAPTEAPEENLHSAVHRLLQEHGGDLNKTKAALKESHGLSHGEAHEATRAFLALHTGMKGLQAFKRKRKNEPDAKLAKPKPGTAVEPKHLENVAYGHKPINEALAGTSLGFHLRQIGQDHPDLAGVVDRALAREGHVTARATGGDPYAAIGTRLKALKDPRAGMFNWDTMHDSLIQDARVKALVQKLVTKPYGVEGDLGTERKFWDSIHRGFGQGKAGNAEAFWERALRHGGGLKREQIAASITRLKDRALDREYVQTVGAESKRQRDSEPGSEHWRGVMGAAPSEQHAKYGRKEQWLSQKIRKLIGEGKEQKQAVAIALSMWREGGHGDE